MSKIKRTLALLLASVMLFSSVSCDTDTPANTDGERESVTETEKETEKATETEKKTETESKSETKGDEAVTETTAAQVPEVFFGYYNVNAMPEDKSELIDLEKSDKVNCLLVGSSNRTELAEHIENAIEHDNYFWVYCTFLEGTVVKGEMRIKPKWKEQMESIVKFIKEKGGYDRFLGWYMDEPLLNHYSVETVYEISKHNHDTYGKRFFICFAVEAFAPDVYSDGIIPVHMSREYSTYITDAAYDMYWEYKPHAAKYNRANKRLREAMPENCKIWYIPWTYTSANDTVEVKAEKTEKLCLEHLNAMYEFLKEEENPGGLVCFLYRGKGLGFYGIQECVDAGYWGDLYARVLEIGEEISAGKMNSEK